MLYDKQTQSHWLHITGECIEGPLKGEVLRAIPGRHVLWSEWKRDHPGGEIALPDARFAEHHFDVAAARRGREYFPPMFPSTIQTRDERLPLTALCLGIRSGNEAKAYPLDTLAKVEDGVVNDVVGGTPVVIVFDVQTYSAAGHGRTLDGKTVSFSRTAEGLLLDGASGSIFDRDGICTSGPHLGTRLPVVHALQAEWYGWYATWPETTVFELPKQAHREGDSP